MILRKMEAEDETERRGGGGGGGGTCISERRERLFKEQKLFCRDR